VEDGSTFALVGLLIIIAAFAFAENILYRNLFRYLFSVMPGFVAIFANVLAKLNQSGNHNRNFQIVSTALSICIGLTVSRIVVSIVVFSKQHVDFSKSIRFIKPAIAKFYVV